MSLTMPGGFAELIEDFRERTPDDGKLHLAHLQCQYDRDTVIVICGLEEAWSGFTEDSEKPTCEVCDADWVRCPVCNAVFGPPKDRIPPMA